MESRLELRTLILKLTLREAINTRRERVLHKPLREILKISTMSRTLKRGSMTLTESLQTYGAPILISANPSVRVQIMNPNNPREGMGMVSMLIVLNLNSQHHL
jgi:hypothetical protein